MTTFQRLATALLLLSASAAQRAQTVNSAQAVTLQGLVTTGHSGAVRAAAFAPDGSLVLLLDMHDGIRVERTNAAATSVLSTAHTGATGDSGVSMALDPSGNIYVAGTTTSGTLTGTSGTAFPARADTSTNSFLAKFDPSLNWST